MVVWEGAYVLLDDHMTPNAVVKAWLDDKVPTVDHPSVAPDCTKLVVHSEGGLVPVLSGEGEGVVARLVQQGEGRAVEDQSGTLKTIKVKVD